LLSAFFILLMLSSTGQPGSDNLELADLFGPVEGTFVCTNLATGQTLRYNPDRAAKRLGPCSTFKIPNSLIALDCGVAADEFHRIRWDKQKYPAEGFFPKPWQRDHHLQTALQNSVVWYYRELALAIGEERMVRALARMDYGNRDISGGLDRFWLDNSLQISADEQVVFLKKFYLGELGFAPRATEIVKRILVLEQGDGYRLSAKTGSNGKGLGWLVGYLERGDDVWLFAFNGQWPADTSVLGQRLPLVKSIFARMNILP